MILRNALFVVIFVALFVRKTLAQHPNVPCPNVFEYARSDDKNIGLITVNKVSYGDTVVEIELSQSGSINSGNEGSISLDIDEDKLTEYIRSGKPITYRVNFPLKNEVPQVSAIKVNGNTVCYGQRVPAPSTTISLKHILTTTGPLNMPKSFNALTPWPISSTSSNEYPSVPCPNIFRYVRVDDLDIGLITVEGVNYGETVLEIELSQPGSFYSGLQGYLSLNIEENKIFEYIRSRKPITYKVNFPLKDVIPQVSAIRLNGNIICFGRRVRAPSTTMTLKHTLTAPPPPGEDLREQTIRTPTTRLPWAPFKNYSRPTFGNLNNLSPIIRRPNRAFPFDSQNPFFNGNNRFEYNFEPRITTQKTTDATTSPPTISTTTSPTTQPSATTSSTSTTSPPTTSTTTTVPPQDTTTSTTTEPQTTTTTTIKPEPERSVTLQYINSVCGRENLNFTAKRLAVNGEMINRSRFPWIVAVYKKTAESLTFQCGGSLISSRTVISAAHCFYSGFDLIKNEDILISLGRHNLTDWSDSSITYSDVEKIIRHPDYRPELINIDADLALVQLKNFVTFSRAIRPVCLWQGPLNVRDIEGVSGIVVGWGRDEHNSNVTTSPRLVTANVASEITCIRSNDQLFYLTSNRTLCAGNRDGTGPCNGDSGSGLMIRNRNKWMIRGTVSAALGDPIHQCNLDEYVVYTDIAMFIGWIQENMLL